MAARQAAALAEARTAPHPTDRRARILDAATTIVSRRGWAGATVTEIVATAGVSLADFERCFDGKEDCFLAAYDEAVARIEEWVRADLTGWGDGWALGVRRAVRATADLLDADPRLAHLCSREAFFAGPRGLARHQATVARLVPALRGGRELGSAPEGIPEDHERTAIAAAILSLGRAPSASGLTAELTYFLLTPYLGAVVAARLAEEA